MELDGVPFMSTCWTVLCATLANGNVMLCELYK